MSDFSISSVKTDPYFELEDFMNFARETRLSSEAFEELANFWEEWKNALQARQITAADKSWLILWLPEEVERIIDEKWEKSASEGFLLNTLAQFMCMSAIEEIIPKTGQGGCAPLPKLEPQLRAALDSLNLMAKEKGEDAINRKFAVLTYYPFRGGCENCDLKEQCPKLKGGAPLPTYTLPGYE